MQVKRCWVVLAVGVVGLAIPVSAGAEVPDARCEGPPNWTIGDYRVAQSFTALNTGHLVGFQAVAENVAAPSSWTVQIDAVDGSGRPANAPLAETTIPVGTTPPAGGSLQVGGTFATPALVTAGTTYALVIAPSTPGIGNLPMATDGDRCPGQAYGDSSLNPGTWPFSYAALGLDLIFATFVEPPQPTKADRTLTLDANKNKVTKGQRVRLSGQVDAPQNEAGCEPDQTVELQRKKKKAPESAFEAFVTLQSATTGKFTTVFLARKTRVYRAVAAETATCEGVLSNTEKVKVKKRS